MGWDCMGGERWDGKELGWDSMGALINIYYSFNGLSEQSDHLCALICSRKWDLVPLVPIIMLKR